MCGLLVKIDSPQAPRNDGIGQKSSPPWRG